VHQQANNWPCHVSRLFAITFSCPVTSKDFTAKKRSHMAFAWA